MERASRMPSSYLYDQ
ncbi:hypothetical protein RCM87_15180 [Escherichia marmotae]|uniref:Uncharacterized protein n=1 Tax=Escherichia marmotae TaxID=1499973 RepID=A0AAW5MHB1_9ESCH|nr:MULTISPECIES: hypothetical protein [Escherichia]MBY7303219.1 hypothetical protein [Escherichia marmotae]MBY7378590.1 hypothetical protein [Escherichia marmotae]MBY7387983.1 hypothetical protein [Escherichia marmotae]MBY7412011.1 hypothetical protein [Escherichia marmotae]MBY7470998.1 hypothetical protein [Escherichia marmotae]